MLKDARLLSTWALSAASLCAPPGSTAARLDSVQWHGKAGKSRRWENAKTRLRLSLARPASQFLFARPPGMFHLDASLSVAIVPPPLGQFAPHAPRGLGAIGGWDR